MSESIADMVAGVVESQLPTSVDLERFRAAARGILRIDGELKRRLREKQRRKVSRGSIRRDRDRQMMFDELWRAIDRVSVEPYTEEDQSQAPETAYRILMAYVVRRATTGPTPSRNAIIEATLLLRELCDEAERLIRQTDGAKNPGRQYPPSLLRRLETEALDWRSKYPKGKKVDFVAHLYGMRSELRSSWASKGATKTWLYTHCPDLMRDL